MQNRKDKKEKKSEQEIKEKEQKRRTQTQQNNSPSPVRGSVIGSMIKRAADVAKGPKTTGMFDDDEELDFSSSSSESDSESEDQDYQYDNSWATDVDMYKDKREYLQGLGVDQLLLMRIKSKREGNKALVADIESILHKRLSKDGEQANNGDEFFLYKGEERKSFISKMDTKGLLIIYEFIIKHDQSADKTAWLDMIREKLIADFDNIQLKNMKDQPQHRAHVPILREAMEEKNKAHVHRIKSH